MSGTAPGRRGPGNANDAHLAEVGTSEQTLFDAASPLSQRRVPNAPVPPDESAGPFAKDSIFAFDEPMAATTKAETAAPPRNNQPITSQVPMVELSRGERWFEVAHRWRSLLGFAFAATITLAAVVAYRSPDDAGADFALESSETEQQANLTPGQQPESADDAATTQPSAADGETPAGGLDQPATSTAPLTPTDSSDQPPASSNDPASSSETDATTTPTAAPEPSTSAPTDPTASTTSPETTPDGSTDPGSPTTATPTRIEAEAGTLYGAARVRSDHMDYSGTGFVGDIITPDSGVSIMVDSPTGGPTPFTLRYAAGPTGPEGPRTLSVLINDQPVSEAQMGQTATWDDWDIIAGELDLVAGPNTVTILLVDDDTGWANIDYIEIN